MPEPVTIRCPHCQHLLSLPEEFLGKVVTCLECTMPMRAPVRNDGVLTEPVPLKKARGVPARLFVPLFGLLLLGFATTVLNTYLLVITDSKPDAAKAFAKALLENLFEKEPPEAKTWKEEDGKAKVKPGEAELKRREAAGEAFRKEQNRKLDEMIDGRQPMLKPMLTAGLVTGVLTLIGGLAFLLRRGYWLAFVGCAAACLNSPLLGCCFVGFIVAVWGVMALISDEGRRYFGRGV